MGISLFGVDIALEISDAVPIGDLPEIKFIQIVDSGPDSADPIGPNLSAVTTVFISRGTVRSYTHDELNESSQIERDDRRVLALGEPLTALGYMPRVNDRVQYTDLINGFREQTIMSVEVDAALAKYICQCRG